MEAKAGDLSLARQLVVDGLRVDPYHGALWTVYAIIERQLGSEGKARKVLVCASQSERVKSFCFKKTIKQKRNKMSCHSIKRAC